MSQFSLSRAAAVALALGVAAPVAALGQAAAPAPAAAAPAAAPLPTDDQTKLGREIAVASGLDKSFVNAVGGMMDQLGRTLTRTRPDMINELRAVMLDNENTFMKEAESMVDLAGKILGSQLTEQELKDTLAYFNSPAGRKYVAGQTVLFDALALAGSNWRDKVSTIMLDKVRAEMKKKGFDF